MKIIGRKIRNWRIHDIKATQAELAQKLGVGQTMISNAENGGESAIDRVLTLINRIYQVEQAFFGYSEENALQEDMPAYSTHNGSASDVVKIQNTLIRTLQENANLISENARLRAENAGLRNEVTELKKGSGK